VRNPHTHSQSRNRISLSEFLILRLAGQRYPGQITFAIANTGSGATGQIDPAAVTYHLVSEQHKNVITPVIGNARERRCSERGREEERSSELRKRRDVWFGNANRAQRNRSRRANGTQENFAEINLVSQ